MKKIIVSIIVILLLAMFLVSYIFGYFSNNGSCAFVPQTPVEEIMIRGI